LVGLELVEDDFDLPSPVVGGGEVNGGGLAGSSSVVNSR
jgi:hypothetical protein